MEIDFKTIVIIILAGGIAYLLVNIIWPWLRQYLKIAAWIIGVLTIIALAVYGIRFAPPFQMASFLRKAVRVDVITAVVLLAGLYFTRRRIITMEDRVDVDRSRIKVDQTRAEADQTRAKVDLKRTVNERDGQITDRFAKAVELLTPLVWFYLDRSRSPRPGRLEINGPREYRRNQLSICPRAREYRSGYP